MDEKVGSDSWLTSKHSDTMTMQNYVNVTYSLLMTWFW